MNKKIIKGQHVRLVNMPTDHPEWEGAVVPALHNEYPDGGVRVRPPASGYDWIFHRSLNEIETVK